VAKKAQGRSAFAKATAVKKAKKPEAKRPASQEAQKPKGPQPVASKPQAPPAIDDLSRRDVMATLRELFAGGTQMDREETLRALQAHFGWQRLGPKVRAELEADLVTAVKRGILHNERGTLSLATRSMSDYTKAECKQHFLAAQVRAWVTREEAIRTWARHLGFRRAGPQIQELGRSVINGLLREGRLEADGRLTIRKT
jgi:hypothetical protein